MSRWIDEQYIGLVSPQLPRFKRQSSTTFTFRCVFCGDSRQRTYKTRGYLFLHKDGYFFKCHNCNLGLSFRQFLERLDSGLYREYQLEHLRERNGYGGGFSVAPVINVNDYPVVSSPVTLPTIASLPPDHIARVYCEGRHLPARALQHLHFTSAWTEWIAALGWDYTFSEDGFPRLILPWYDSTGRLLGAQARRIDVTGKDARYVTLKSQKDAPKIYGWDRMDSRQVLYVVEGPIDSWFLPNAVAAMGSDLLQLHDRYLSLCAPVYVWDNEPRNRDVTCHLHTAIKRGLRVVIWPQFVQEKDLNDMVRAGHDVLAIVQQHTYHGLRAELEFLRWKKLNDVSLTTAK